MGGCYLGADMSVFVCLYVYWSVLDEQTSDIDGVQHH